MLFKPNRRLRASRGRGARALAVGMLAAGSATLAVVVGNAFAAQSSVGHPRGFTG
jgi:hypothetical protein